VLQPAPITNPGGSLEDVLDPEAEELYSSRALLIVSRAEQGIGIVLDGPVLMSGVCWWIGFAAAGVVVLGELLPQG